MMRGKSATNSSGEGGPLEGLENPSFPSKPELVADTGHIETNTGFEASTYSLKKEILGPY